MQSQKKSRKKKGDLALKEEDDNDEDHCWGKKKTRKILQETNERKQNYTPIKKNIQLKYEMALSTDSAVVIPSKRERSKILP